MCFSATASFAAAGGLGLVGVLSLGRVRTPRQAPFAAIPLLFAAQQACEGLVWRVLERAPFHVARTPWAHAYLFFALLVWPIYVPSALWVLERSASRRRLLLAAVAAGTCIGAYLTVCATLRDSNACVAFGNLYYWVQVDTSLKRVLLACYVATISMPLVVSSVRGTSVLAGVTLASFAIVGLLYRAGFVSVWCFFAAIISGLTALQDRRELPNRPSSYDSRHHPA